MDNSEAISQKNSKVETDNLNNTSIKKEECFALPQIVIFIFVMLTIITIVFIIIIYIYTKITFVPILNDYIQGYNNGITEGVKWIDVDNATYVVFDKSDIIFATMFIIVGVIASIALSIQLYKIITKKVYNFRVTQIKKYSQDAERKIKKSYITNFGLEGWLQDLKKVPAMFFASISILASFVLIFCILDELNTIKYLVKDGWFDNPMGDSAIKQFLQNADNICFRFGAIAPPFYYINHNQNFAYISLKNYFLLILGELLFGIGIILGLSIIVKEIKFKLHRYCPICTIYRKLNKNDVYKSINSQVETKKEWADIEVRNRYSDNTFSNPYTIQTMKDQQYDVQTHFKTRLYKCNYCENEIIYEKVTQHSYKIN